jgi:hypothetical protein
VHTKTLVHHDISSADSCVSVTNSVGEADGDVIRPVRKEARGLRGYGGLRIDAGWQGLILDVDEFSSVLSLSPIVSDDDGHRLPYVTYPVTRQWQLWCGA